MGVASQNTVADEAAVETGANASAAASFQADLRGFSSLSRLMLRVLTLVLCVLTLAFLLSSKEHTLKGFLDIEAKWSDSKALVFLASTTAICLGYSFLCTALFIVALSSNGKAFARIKALKWMLFFADQLLAYAMLSAAAASAEVAYLAKNGQVKSGWFAVCGVVGNFCNKVGLALVLSFFTVIPLAINAFLSAYQLKSG